MKAVKNLKLEDVHFPKIMLDSFRGPEYGIQGIRKLFKIYDRPLTASVPKPKVGMNTNEFNDVAYKIWKGGLDFVKTDENMTSQKFVNFYKTTEKVLKTRDKIEKETRERKMFLANVTAETNEMIKRAKFVKNHGGEFVMLDVVTAGFAAFQTLREFCHDNHMAIWSHRAMHAMFTRNPKHGMSMLTLAKFVRLVGGDSLHVGTVGKGKLVGKKDEVLRIEHELEQEMAIHFNAKEHVLNQKWNSIKPVLVVSSGGLHAGSVPYIMRHMGNDIAIQIGGGCHGHPSGTEAGAKSVRQAIDATMNNISLEEYSKTHKELKEALGKWGHVIPV
nr:RuBisCO long chain, Form III-b [uncultured archaeon]